MEIGIDIESTKKFLMDKKHAFVGQFYTPKEVEYAYASETPHLRLCGMFCAKEAVLKALSVPSLHLKEIEIEHGPGDKPFVKIANKKAVYKSLSVSISHCADYAAATALVEKQ